MDPGAPVASLENLQHLDRTLLALVTLERLWAASAPFGSGVDALLFGASAAGLGAYSMSRVRGGGLRGPLLFGFAGLQAVVVLRGLPWTPDGHFLALWLLLLLALFDLRRTEERALLVGAVRWLGLIVLAYAGLQKLVHGFYFRGELLTYLIAFRDQGIFDVALAPLLAPDERARIVEAVYALGAGPFRSRAPGFVTVANLTWLWPMLCALGLSLRTTRTAACCGALAYVLAAGLLAFEPFYSMLAAAALLLFTPHPLHRLALPAFAPWLAWLAFVRLGWGAP